MRPPSTHFRTTPGTHLCPAPFPTHACADSLRAHACFGLLIKAQVNALTVLLSSHGLHTSPHSWTHKKWHILLEGRQSFVMPIHHSHQWASEPYRFSKTNRFRPSPSRGGKSLKLDTLKTRSQQAMDPFLGVPMPVTPPAEVRECMATQLGQDVFLGRGGPLNSVFPPGLEVSKEEINIAHRFCTTLE